MESSKGSSYSPSNGEFIVQEKRWSGRCGWFDSFLLSVSSFSFLRKNLRRIEYEKYVYFKFARIKDTTWNIGLRWKTFFSILSGSIKHSTAVVLIEQWFLKIISALCYIIIYLYRYLVTYSGDKQLIIYLSDIKFTRLISFKS